MKKTIIFSFGLCFLGTIFSFDLSAQEYKNFDLSKYYTPDIVRNQLDLSFSGNGSFNNQKSSSDSVFQNTLNGSLSPFFKMYKNTRKLVSKFQVNGSFQGQSNGSENLNDLKNSLVATQSTTDLNIGYDVQFYNPKKQFLLLGIHGNIGQDGNMNHFTTNSVKTKAGNRNSAGGFGASIGLGFGRIESVEDARQAIYILDELSKKGVLTRQLSDDEIFQLSQQISRVKNKRFLDSRLHLIDEITSIDSFFVSNKLLTKSDASYFTTVYDYWQYGALNDRKSGHEFAIKVSPTVSLSSNNSLSVDSLTWAHGYSNFSRGELSLTYNYEKPVSLNWQHSANVSLIYTSTLYDQKNLPETNYPSTNSKFAHNDANLQGSYYIRYYPNTRTNYSIGLTQSLSLMSYDDKNSSTTSPNTYHSSTSFNFNASYYFSPQFRLSGNAGIGCNFQSSDNYKFSALNGGISASLIYSFF